MSKKTTNSGGLGEEDKEKLSSLFSSWGEQQEKNKHATSKGPLESYTVSEITRSIKDCLVKSFSQIAVLGEISQVNYGSSGHCYISLIDEDSTLSVVIFLSDLKKLVFNLEAGLAVQCEGDISLWSKRGQYQLIAHTVKSVGIGEQELRYKQLKKKLEDEGLFDSLKKIPLPKDINSIALITSDQGAVLHDFIKVLQETFAYFRVVVYGVGVSGDDAKEIVAAIDRAENNKHDVVVLARGGGAKEELNIWNDEELIRRLAACNTPTISAIGHEVNWVLTDLVCDTRAATPSQAASVIACAKKDIFMEIVEAEKNLGRALISRIDKSFLYLSSFSLSHLKRSLEMKVSLIHYQFSATTSKLIETFSRELQSFEHDLFDLEKRIHPFSDRCAKMRGYARIYSNGQWIKKASQLEKDQEIIVELHDGNLDATIKRKKENKQ